MERMIGRTRVRIEKGDLTEVRADAIVNAANSRLAHGGGVAGAIVRRGGGIIQDESDAWLRVRGEVPVGGAALTGGGSLPARHVIHSVGPRMGEGDEDFKLREATLSALRLAEEHNYKSIAFPAISTGIFGYPMERCAKVMIRAVLEYLEQDRGIEDVIFRMIDENKFRLFQEALESESRKMSKGGMISMRPAINPIDLKTLRERLKGPKPGMPAQRAMWPQPLPDPLPVTPDLDCHEAAVLLLNYPKNKPHVVLTLRTMDVQKHQGQISLPGGRLEAGEDAVRAALRETEEELGVAVGPEFVAGILTPLYIKPSGHVVTPVVAVLDFTPHFLPSSREVNEVLEVPVSLLLDPASIRTERRMVLGGSYPVPYYAFHGHKIWGATAMILAEFSTLIGAGV